MVVLMSSSFVRLKILLVDDDVSCLRGLENLLELDGHEISTATRGQEAVDLARQLRREKREPELSILDYHVPDLTGLETYELLSQELPGLGAIFVTGDASSGLEERILEAGGLALVRKPLDSVRIRGAVKTFQRRWSSDCEEEFLG
tara:strand:+ start:350 stop:787 length:438 start_codon:yes stop_codon:yes gene_type:complete